MPSIQETGKNIREVRKGDPTFAQRQGALLLRVSGDIKRSPEFLASEIGESIETVQSVLLGNAGIIDRDRIIEKMVGRYPFSRLNLEVVRDDTDEGAIIWRVEDAIKTSRVFDRRDHSGLSSSYYEYRDAAMSTLGPFRPEWIKELRVVQSTDPDDPDVAYNKGHFLHQLTLYVGPVNLYWKNDQGSHIAHMSTGDSNYGTPYIPHSFTSRDSNQEAYIMAVTFGGKLEFAVQQELSVLHPERIKQSLIDLSSEQTAFSGLFVRRLQDTLLSPSSISKITQISPERVSSFCEGRDIPTIEELEMIAGALGINVRDLLPPNPIVEKEVVIKRFDEQKRWLYPSDETPHYLAARLAGSPKVSEVKGFIIEPLIGNRVEDEASLDLETPMHTFGYNFGKNSVVLYWEGEGGIRNAIIEPGASFYLKPLKKHGLRQINSPTGLMIVRIGGNLSGDTLFELSSLPKESIARLLHETGLWY